MKFNAAEAKFRRDKLKGKRYRVGERHWCAKLTEDDVRQIRRDRRTYREIAAQFKISVSQVSDIKNGFAWACVK